MILESRCIDYFGRKTAFVAGGVVCSSQAKVTSPPKARTGKRKKPRNKITGIKLFVDKKPKMRVMLLVIFFL